MVFMVNLQGDDLLMRMVILRGLGHYSSLQDEQRVYLLVDQDDYDHPMYIERLDVIAVGDTIEEIERESGLFPEVRCRRQLPFTINLLRIPGSKIS